MLNIPENNDSLLTEVVGDHKNDEKRKVIITEEGEEDGLIYEDEIFQS